MSYACNPKFIETIHFFSTKEAGVEMFSWFLPKRLRIYYRT